MNHKLLIAIVLTALIAGCTQTSQLKFCENDSDCICCDYYLRSGEEYRNDCFSRDLAAECVITEDSNAFAATHNCKCINNSCVTVVDRDACIDNFMRWCEGCRQSSWEDNGRVIARLFNQDCKDVLIEEDIVNASSISTADCSQPEIQDSCRKVGVE